MLRFIAAPAWEMGDSLEGGGSRYAAPGNFLEHPKSQQTVRAAGAQAHTFQKKKHFGVTSNMTCSMVPHVGRRQLQLIMQLLNYSTVLTRRAHMRRTGDHGLPMLYANVN